MWVKITIIGAISLILALSPKSMWETLWHWLARRQKRISIFFARLRARALPFRGRLLQQTISNILASPGGGRSITPPRYKFYSEILSLIVGYNRSHGAPMRAPLLSLQEMISVDLKFTRKERDIFSGTLCQFFLIAVVVWFFSFFAQSVGEFKRDLITDLTIAGLQLLGTAIFFIMAKFFRRRILGWMETVLPPLATFGPLLEVGISCSDVLRLSKIEQAIETLGTPGVNFQGEQERLRTLLRNWQEQGVLLKEEWQGFVADIWQLGRERLDLYSKRLEVVKFTILVLFFLGSYFVYLSHLFSCFLIA